MTRDARPVFPFDLTLVWPMRLREIGSRELASQECVLRAFGYSRDGTPTSSKQDTGALHTWTVVNPLEISPDKADSGYAYAEMVYFHPFVRRLLFEDRTCPFKLLRYNLDGSETVEVDDNRDYDPLLVKSLRFYAMDDGAAILVTQLSAEKATTWAKALNCLSYLRTIHFQHYKQVNGAWVGGGAPQSVRMGGFEVPAGSGSGKNLKDALKNKRPAVLGHWKAVLNSLRPGTDDGFEIELLGDNRMPVMVLAATPEPETLSDDEWFALVEADGSEFQTYAPKFREGKLRSAAYDRWWDRKEKPQHRYLVGSMTFAAVIRNSEAEIPEWLQGYRKRWHRQWFDLFFLAHFQRASLLVLQDRITDAVSSLPGRDRTGLLGKIEDLQRDVAVFSSRFWFTEISAQVQPQELFDLLQRQLRLRRLFRDVVHDKRLLADWVTTNEQEARTKLWEDINRIALPAGLVIALMGIGGLVQPILRWMAGLPTWVLPLFGASWTPFETKISEPWRISGNYLATMMLLFLIVSAVWFFWSKRRR